MTRKKILPKFPNSYVGEKAAEYDSLTWMERNQKNTTLRTLRMLFDKKLSKNDLKDENTHLFLDLGCGTGFSSEILVEHGFRVVGVDILMDMLSKAYEKKKIHKYQNYELLLADINNLPFKEDIFDHIISISAYNFITFDRLTVKDKKKGYK